MSSRWDDLPEPEPPPIIRPRVSLEPPPQDPWIDLGLGKPCAPLGPPRRGMPRWLSALIFCMVSAGLVAGLMLGLRRKGAPRTSLEILAFGPQTICEHDTLRLTIPVKYSGFTADEITYGMSDAPEGATIDAKKGVISWKPSEEQGPGSHRLTLKAFASGVEERMAQGEATIEVLEVNDPPQIAPIADRTVRAGETLSFRIEARDPNHEPRALQYELSAEGMLAAAVDAETGQFEFTAGPFARETCPFEVRVRQKGEAAKGASRRFVVHVEGLDEPAPAIPAAASADTRQPLAPRAPAQPKPATKPEAKPGEESRADAIPTTPAFREPPPEEKKPVKKKRGR